MWRQKNKNSRNFELKKYPFISVNFTIAWIPIGTSTRATALARAVNSVAAEQ